jgi:hypothetical protein
MFTGHEVKGTVASTKPELAKFLGEEGRDRAPARPSRCCSIKVPASSTAAWANPVLQPRFERGCQTRQSAWAHSPVLRTADPGASCRGRSHAQHGRTCPHRPEALNGPQIIGTLRSQRCLPKRCRRPLLDESSHLPGQRCPAARYRERQGRRSLSPEDGIDDGALAYRCDGIGPQGGPGGGAERTPGARAARSPPDLDRR